MRRFSFAKFAWALLFYNLGVIVWGGFVRASFSGDGCGAHWPNCGATLLPSLQQRPQIIEFIHRITSGLDLPLVLVLVFMAWRLYPKSHPVRLAALASLLFTITEALIGAVLVKKSLVAYNDSMLRAIVMSIHLTNTFILLTSFTLTAWWASGNAPIRFKQQGALGFALALGFVGTLILGISGAVTALGDMLFPAATLLQGLHDDLSPTAHFLVRLRLFHPLIATSVGPGSDRRAGKPPATLRAESSLRALDGNQLRNRDRGRRDQLPITGAGLDAADPSAARRRSLDRAGPGYRCGARR